MNDNEPFLITPEVARMLNRSPRTVQRLVDTGELVPAQKLPGPNGAYLFRRADVDALVASRSAA